MQLHEMTPEYLDAASKNTNISEQARKVFELELASRKTNPKSGKKGNLDGQEFMIPVPDDTYVAGSGRLTMEEVAAQYGPDAKGDDGEYLDQSSTATISRGLKAVNHTSGVAAADFLAKRAAEHKGGGE